MKPFFSAKPFLPMQSHGSHLLQKRNPTAAPASPHTRQSNPGDQLTESFRGASKVTSFPSDLPRVSHCPPIPVHALCVATAPALQAIQDSWGMTIQGWTKDGSCDKALGLTCSASGMVEDISLTQSDSSAGFATQTLPLALFNLTSLTRLRLIHFNFQGSIPEALGNLLHLQVLALYNNNLTGPLPASLTNLDRLSILQMDFNRITSPIPELAPTMEHLNLQHNCLTGTMPDWLSKLKGLQNLSLNNNNLTGTLPDGIAQLRSLTTLRLNTNELSGLVPTFLGDLRALKDLTLQGNQLSGTIPATLGGLDALKDFQVPENLACPDNSTWCVVPQTNTTAFCSHCSGFCATCSLEAPPSPPVDRCAGVVCSGNFMVLQMSSKHHPHLVRLLGFAMGGNVRSQIEQVLIYELMPHGDLHKWMGRVMSGREATFMEAKQQQHILFWVQKLVTENKMECIADPGMEAPHNAGYRPDISVEGAEGVEAMIVCVGIVGQANNPLYLQSFLEADDPLKFHFIVHCSLDVIDERVSTPRRGGANEPYLGLLYPTEDFRVYGYVSNTQIKFIIVVDGLDLRESDIRNFFKRLHSAYVDATSNPFHVPGKRISSPAFAERVGALVHSVSPPKAT
ncbi:unnamed protein product [Closterium sp. NIES-65]|nr:unnamed protein product [Closterium sp. NIES-65]